MSAKQLVVCIVSSRYQQIDGPYNGGIRTTHDFVVCTIVNLSQSDIGILMPHVSQLVDHWFADISKTVDFEMRDDELLMGNILSELKFQQSDVSAFAFNSSKLTVDASIASLRSNFGEDLSGLSFGIIGLGRIGFQIALELLSEGANVSIYNNDHSAYHKKLQTLQLLKASHSQASVQVCSLLSDVFTTSQCVLSCSSTAATVKFPDISQIPLASLPQTVIDVGKFNFDSDSLDFLRDNGVNIFRLDVGSLLLDYIITRVSSSLYPNTPSSSHIQLHDKSVRVISGGFQGCDGDLIVDDSNHPQFILGKLHDNTIKPY